MPRVRIHQHVNPLAPHFQQPQIPLNFKEIFASEQPLHLDIGCARGRFLLKMANAFPLQNFLGVEIRKPLVTEANRVKNEQKLDNLHYEFCNATFFLDELLVDLPNGILQTVTIQFPDPWYKRKHAKRRMVNDELVLEIAKNLRSDGKIFIQTDVEFLAAEMSETFNQTNLFQKTLLKENPFPIKTEREISVETRNLPVYRAMFGKK